VRIDLLERVFAQLIRRHEVLRTTSRAGGQPVQIVLAVRFRAREDLSATLCETRDAEVRRLAQEEAEQPFNLGQGPLVRVKMLRLAEQEHVLL